MQKKHYFLVLLLIATTILVGGCFKKKNKPIAAVNNTVNNPVVNQNQEQNTNENQNQANTQTNETMDPSGQYSINELFAFNKPMKCSWKESVTGDSDVTNIIYLNDKKFYQDVTMGDIGHSYAIYDEEYLYIWNSFNDMASKMKNTGATTGTEPKKDSAGLDQKKDFICESWIPDNSVFIPPSDKNFKDVTEEMNQAVQDLNSGGAERINKQICDQCKKAPTPELQAQCLGEIKCE